jgi:RND family efflux transporter MFP subunit
MKKFILPLVTTLFFIVLIGCSNQEKQEDDKEKIHVKVVEVQKENLVIPIVTSGKLSSKTEVKLSFKTGGIISNIFVDEGQTVVRNTLLAQLDLSEINAKYVQAELAFQKTERDFIRVENLYHDSVATLEYLQNARTAQNLAKANLDIALFNLEYSKITAPSNGKILKRLAHPNEIIASGHPVLLFASSEDDWVVRVNIIDRDIINISLNDTARVHFDAYQNKTFIARISEIANAADPYTGTYEVELKLLKPAEKLVSGFIAKVEILPSVLIECLIVPVGALIEANGHEGYVYQVIDRKPVKKKVNILKIGERIYINGGINAGDKVIVEGVNYVNNNSDIIIE